MNEKDNILKLSSLYISTTIGAGFASGKEIYIFFSRYGSDSIIGICLSGILFVIVGAFILEFIRIFKPDNMEDLFERIVGSRLSFFASILTTVFLTGVLSIMMSGMSHILTELFDIDLFVSSIITALLCLLILFFGIKAVVAISQIVTPTLIVSIFVLCYMLLNNEISVFSNPYQIHSWKLSSVLYISYNIVNFIIVLINAKYLLTSKKASILSGILGGFTLFLSSYIINSVLIKYYHISVDYELPMLSLASNYSPIVFTLWSLVLFLAMLTTAISSAIGCTNYISSKINLPLKVLSTLFITVTLILSYIGFSNLIEVFYPVFGYIGILTILLMTVKLLKLKFL